MQILAGLTISGLIVVSILVAVRLLLLYRRTTGMPELLLGLMLFTSVGLGYPLLIAGARIGGETGSLVSVFGSFGSSLGFAFLFAFTQQVFRRDAAWAPALVALGAVTLLGTACLVAYEVLIRSVVYRAGDVTFASVTNVIAVIVAYLWTAWESLRYRAMALRRLRLGMGDPVVCNRLLLWGVMGLTSSSGVVLNIGAASLGLDLATSPGVLLCSSATGMTQTIVLVLAFFPPHRYLEWVRAERIAEPA